MKKEDLWQRHRYPKRTIEYSPAFLVSLLKALGMIDGDSKYLNDEAMDFVFRQQRPAVQQPSSIVLNQGVPETPPESKYCLHNDFLKRQYWA